MPNRILKESICTSEEIDKLTEQQEVFFYRLMVACDDYGLMDARPAILKARCYPLKAVDCKRIQMMLDALNEVGLIGLYLSDGKPYLHITNWEKHQSIRAKKPKYPYPQADDFICKQMQADVPVIQSNPIQSESNPNPTHQQANDPRFAQFWSIYPRKSAKDNAQKAWVKAKINGEFEQVLESVRKHCQTEQWQKGVIPHAATWINQKRWLDELSLAASSPIGSFV